MTMPEVLFLTSGSDNRLMPAREFHPLGGKHVCRLADHPVTQVCA